MAFGDRVGRIPSAGRNTDQVAAIPSGHGASDERRPLLWLAVGLLGASLGFLLMWPPAPSAAQAETGLSNDQCLACHDRDRLTLEFPSGEVVDATVDGAGYAASAHGAIELSCRGCHTAITRFPHPESASADARSYATAVNATCGGCHDQGAATTGDAHQGAAGGPLVCSDCHGSHDIVADPDPLARVAMCDGCHQAVTPVSGVHAPTMTDHGAGVSCSDCHGSHTVVDSAPITPACSSCHQPEAEAYASSAHGTARASDGDAATCTDCHGPAHTILATTDPAASTYPLQLPETCGTCHGDAAFAEEHGLSNVYDQYVDSIHGHAVMDQHLLIAANCATCHGSHDIAPHDDPASSVSRPSVASTCGQCHGEVEALYRASLHGTKVASGDLTAATCTDCHSAHQIAETDTVEWQLEVIRECGTCHDESLDTYRDTFHGQVTSLGYTRVAKCSDCHEHHTIHAVDDPGSSVSDQRRIATCQRCHPAANANFVRFSPHADSSNPEDGLLLYYSKRFMDALIIGVLGFFVVHSFLWGWRAFTDRRGDGGGGRRWRRNDLDSGAAGAASTDR